MGISTIEDWLTPIEKDEPNPFRSELRGRHRLVFVAPDTEYELAFNDRLNQHFVTVSQTEAGFYLARKQMDAYHYPQTELGKPVGKMRPKKEFDDIVDTIRGYSVNWNRKPIKRDRIEAREAALPMHLQDREQIIAAGGIDAERMMLARTMEFQKLDKKESVARAAVSKMRPTVPRVGLRRGR
jgi:hypothetical protein